MARKVPEVLTAKQAKDFLQISDSTLRRYIRKGKLKAYRLAGERDLRFRREDLLALLEPANGVVEKEPDQEEPLT
ncbi:MAG TPA: helix-turn-helix domain-containing protein [Armatimonadota bacterium]|jgi:excisionase family DNA binding protein|nr:helix-turn-helix domain-containing protein [Armatimonadota bacterium]HOM82227.1 helix-turn-helix domain-containing protein [Armatimonadota bacterium]HOQ29179.1 helix-turn-helix domain-containing protein [Armatimonadota bacterium]HPO74318.1 helix-turn-helix domain-containing protein [Armatimonadota bacterium]HPT98913.1 helix-turn-helix domain-containing protein [Armatimonadota bacterium]